MIARFRRPFGGIVVAAVGLALTTVLTAFLESALGVPDASVVYLLPVVAVGISFGSWPAVGTAVASFLLYDFFFVQPLYAFSITAPEEWLDLLLFLVVAIAIGRLSALQMQRRKEADLRTAESQAMFAMSREIATAATALEAAPRLAERLARQAQMSRVWIGLGATAADERIVASNVPGQPRPSVISRWLLHAASAEGQPNWVRIHDQGVGRSREWVVGGGRERVPHSRERVETETMFRVPIQAGLETIGSIWAARAVGDPIPGRSHTRVLAAAADQLGQSVVRDRLAAEATEAEVARQSDALKSALLDSVSHDLRTPLAAIRAAAGHLMDPDVSLTHDEARAAARSIDLEALRLSRLVRNMLDLSRIEGGALHPSLELYDLADLIAPVVERLTPMLGLGRVELAIDDDLPPVRVDALLLDQIVTNLLENAARHASGHGIRVSAGLVTSDAVELVVEDGGPGVPVAALPRIFDRFYRVPRRQGAREGAGSGVGLAVVRGLAEAMGGYADARPSRLGGLAVAIRLPTESTAEPESPAAEPEPQAAEPEPQAAEGRNE
jgi:two-component system sensor histidine kinase KdpD